jgi:ribonucleotide reductase alpha subunit
MEKEIVKLEVERPFRTRFSQDIFNSKYKHETAETWQELSSTLIDDVCDSRIESGDKRKLIELHSDMKFIAGGRYLYYAGRPHKFFNNCYLLKAEEDSREDWANLSWKSESALLTGGGIGTDYSIYRPAGSIIKKTGGLASGSIPKMKMINEIGRNVMQGGSRRSAIYASLNWQHGDISEFLYVKDWNNIKINGAYDENGNIATVKYLKEKNFDYPAPLDMTNISVNYDNAFLRHVYGINEEELELLHKGIKFPIIQIPKTYIENVRQALSGGEPGFSFNFFESENETLRNACVIGETEILTRNGWEQIESLVDQKVEIWNGFEWSIVIPKITNKNIPLLKITLSDGRNITCTNYHKWYISTDYKGSSREVVSEDLKIGDKIIKYNFPVLSDGLEIDSKRAYTQGFISAEGMDDYKYFCLYEPKYMCLPRLDIKYIGNELTSINGIHRKCIKYNGSYELKSFVPLNWNISSKLEWLAGLFDGDGCELKEGGLQLVSVDRNFLYNLQKLLSTIGINSKIVDGPREGYRMMPDGRGGSKEYLCQESDRICIGAIQMQELKSLGFHCERMSFEKDPQRDASQFSKIIKIEDAGISGNVYCFNEPLRHYGIFNGILTGQCTEVTSEDDSDVCNLGSINMSRIDTIEEFKEVVRLVSQFLLCGTLVAKLPYEKVYRVREKNRRLGIGLMGVHEWLLRRGYKYEVVPELKQWLEVYKNESKRSADELADKLGISRPVKYRAIAPTGTIGIMAGTTTGIEPLFAVSYKRRYLKGKSWRHQFVIDGTSKLLIEKYGLDHNKIETALDLAKDPERRIKFQADVQDYVDMSISSTINIPTWGTEGNNENHVNMFAKTLLHYAPRLRGFTMYPDGSRGGQPLTPVDYETAKKNEGQEFTEEFFDVCELGKGGTCGI